jgi:hypothetical protein
MPATSSIGKMSDTGEYKRKRTQVKHIADVDITNNSCRVNRCKRLPLLANQVGDVRYMLCREHAHNLMSNGVLHTDVRFDGKKELFVLGLDEDAGIPWAVETVKGLIQRALWLRVARFAHMGVAIDDLSRPVLVKMAKDLGMERYKTHTHTGAVLAEFIEDRTREIGEGIDENTRRTLLTKLGSKRNSKRRRTKKKSMVPQIFTGIIKKITRTIESDDPKVCYKKGCTGYPENIGVSLTGVRVGLCTFHTEQLGTEDHVYYGDHSSACLTWKGGPKIVKDFLNSASIDTVCADKEEKKEPECNTWRYPQNDGPVKLVSKNSAYECTGFHVEEAIRFHEEALVIFGHDGVPPEVRFHSDHYEVEVQRPSCTVSCQLKRVPCPDSERARIVVMHQVATPLIEERGRTLLTAYGFLLKKWDLLRAGVSRDLGDPGLEPQQPLRREDLVR